jgi:hypothetical protein
MVWLERAEICKKRYIVNKKAKVHIYIYIWGHAVAHLVEALRYKPAGGGFIPDGLIGIFH